MPGRTSFLQLTLPELNEFVNSWHTPLNQNFESIDDYLSDLQTELVGSTGSGALANLKGTKSSLVARLNVSIAQDGTIDLSSASDILELASSRTDGASADMHERFQVSDFEQFDVRPPFSDDRFQVSGPTIPVTSGDFPHAPMDNGIAWRTRDFSSNLMASPPRPWSPGMVYGNTSLLTGAGNDIIKIQGGITPAIFNIDGYLFRIREDVTLDLSAITGIADTNYVWIYVDRDDSGYNNPVFQYNLGAKDLRRLQSGTGTGATSGSTFTATGALFLNIALGKVRPGDQLVITTATGAEGTYTVDSVDLDTQITIKGTFPADVGGLNWYVLDNAHPNVGGVPVADANAVPAQVDGRVYIGRCQYHAGSPPDNEVTFAINGVYDSGWISVTAAALESTVSYNHNLGVHPSQVEIWMRDTLANDPTGEVYRPIVRREITDGGAVVNYLYVPSLIHSATKTAISVRLENDTDGQTAALFTTKANADIATGEMRIIARR